MTAADNRPGGSAETEAALGNATDPEFEALLVGAVAPPSDASAQAVAGKPAYCSSGRGEAPLLREGELVAERFLVQQLAGVGGMGAVYRARDIEQGGFAALKVVAANRGGLHERFARETAVLAGLFHPAIVRYLAHGTTGAKVPFLAMEWLEGEDLCARLLRGPLEPSEALLMIRRVCEALSVVHRQGITHRDLKPSNLFLVHGQPGLVKLVDFGVARADAATRPLTHAGAVVGTVGYMAPEQAMAALDVDVRADVFSIGCVLFECLTGKPAFSGRHDLAVLAKVLREEPPCPSDLRPELGSDFDVLLERLLAKERGMRPSNADAVLRVLDGLEDATWPSRRPKIPSREPHRMESEQRIVSVVLARPPMRDERTIAWCEPDAAVQPVEELIGPFGAELTPIQGGGLLLVLASREGVTAADQAVQAARCALRMARMAPHLLVGVATGTVDRSLPLPVGAAIDRAAGLVEASAASASSLVMIDALTSGLLGSRFDLRHGESSTELLAELDELEAPRLLMGKRTPFVGRDKELALLHATLEECIEDQVARAVLVTAPPGIGKSRLGHEFLDQVKAKGAARVLVARADPISTGSALSLMQRLVRSALAIRADAPRAAQHAGLRAGLAALIGAERVQQAVEFLEELLGIAGKRQASALMRAARNDPEIMREQNRRALTAWFEAESARRPLVLYFEDLHWGDLPSVNFVEEMFRTCASRPLLLVASARPEVHERFPRLWRTLDLHEVQLKGLTRRAAERLVRAALSATASDGIVGRILDLAEGNAFYLEELIRRAADGGTEFPETVLAMVQSRLDSLVPEARRVLRAASVFGATAWKDGISEALGATTDLGPLLELLVQNELLLPETPSRFAEHAQYGFRHALVRDAAYAMLGAADRAATHGMAGAWLERQGEQDARVLADHYEAGGDARRATPWLARAALTAVERGDFGATMELARRGLALGASGSERGILLLVNASASTWGQVGDHSSLPEALTLLPHASTHWWLALSVLIWGATASGDAASSARYLGLASAAAPGPELIGLHGQALMTLASMTIVLGQTRTGWSLLSRFDHLALDDANCDPTFLVWLNLGRAQLATYAPVDGVWKLEQALDWARNAATAMQVAGSASGEAVAQFFYGTTLLFLGAYDTADAAFAESCKLGVSAGNLLIQNYAHLLRAWVHVRRGRYEDARSELACLAEARDSTIVHGIQSIRAELLLRTGQIIEAVHEAHVATRGPAAPYRRMAASTLGRAYLASGRPEDALGAVEAAANDGNAAPNIEFEVDLCITRAKALASVGTLAEARAALERAGQFLHQVADTIRDDATRTRFATVPEAHRELARLQS